MPVSPSGVSRISAGQSYRIRTVGALGIMLLDPRFFFRHLFIAVHALNTFKFSVQPSEDRDTLK